MAFEIKDRWLWLGIGIFALIAPPLYHRTLTYIETLTAPPPKDVSPTPPPLPSPTIPPGPSAISSSSLTLLALDHSSRAAVPARNMIAARFMQDADACRRLKDDLASNDFLTKDRAHTIAAFLEGHGQNVFFANRVPLPRQDGTSGLAPRYTGAGEIERDIRRRRREAFVMNDGVHEVSEEDIFERRRSE